MVLGKSTNTDEDLPSPADLTANVLALVGSLLAMTLIFFSGLKNSHRCNQRFGDFPDAAKADWCSRICSTVHAAVVCTLATICLFTTGFDSGTLVPEGSTLLIRISFSITIGYFLFDQIIMIWWWMPSWAFFTVHHVIILVPYVITQFIYMCHSGIYVLLVFLLQEVSTVPLNAMAFMEDSGYRDTRTHMIMHALTYVTWLVFRGLLPIYLLVVVWTKIVQQLDEPAVICAHLFAMFSITVFCCVLTPEAYTRAKYGNLQPEHLEHNAAIADMDYKGMFSLDEESELGDEGGAYHNLESIEENPTVPAEQLSGGPGSGGPPRHDDSIRQELLSGDGKDDEYRAQPGTRDSVS